MDKTKIEWADSTWNPITGCRHKCPYCYARGIANRFVSRKGCHLVYPYEWDCMSEKQRNKILSKKTVIMSGESGYACKYYEIIGNVNNLSDHDCAIIADGGNLCFGYRMDGRKIVVYTD